MEKADLGNNVCYSVSRFFNMNNIYFKPDGSLMQHDIIREWSQYEIQIQRCMQCRMLEDSIK